MHEVRLERSALDHRSSDFKQTQTLYLYTHHHPVPGINIVSTKSPISMNHETVSAIHSGHNKTQKMAGRASTSITR
ncbi:unnamed protein product [Fusarium graminearum]|uniref:Chromosome 2, complete genome n=1 Tax=Gibberella zeae (strain ATCC MYA-4620 / CBS 123657 / FGSC 9075 / NRRL 31084 / PH-1) TaxID=229533 RepID=A0A098DCM8_GIBZE|nr:unnamed protein product [Fusarium graminearum]CZS79493.1 unnamed protein product [Fusarium graminearum]